jgi:alkylation response protein AidB-like acyl-CoA dehydrogenase
MNLAFSPEQVEWKREVRRFLASHCGTAQARSATPGHMDQDSVGWQRARELGLASMLVPSEHGGEGLGWAEVVATIEETGRALARLPFFSTVCLATNALLAGASEAQRAAYLPAIATGDLLATVAFAEGPRAEPFAIATMARESEGGFELSGAKRYVVDGDISDLLLVTARRPGSSGSDGVGMFLVDARLPGVERKALPTMDLTRRLAVVELRGVRVEASAKMGDARTLRTTLDRAAVALAAESLGGADRCLEMATDYAKSRVQFGRPIGSFQAIKHKLADMFVAVETARSAAYYAACVAQSGDDAELATAAPLAKSYCTEAFFHCAAQSIQIHGGIGFTWEHDAHLFLKRAQGSLALLGSPAGDRERLAEAIGV